MEYGQLIRDAWQLTWRHRFLWILGLFAGGTVGSSLGGGDGNGGTEAWRREAPGGGPPVPGADLGPTAVMAWVAENIGLIGTIVALLMLLGLALLVVSLISQGGMARATADLATGRPSSLGSAWRAGLRLFWRYAGLWLLLIAAALAVGAVVAGFVGFVIGLASAAGQEAVWVILPAVLLGLLLLLAGLGAGAVLIALGVLLALIAVANTFFWSYWTLAYLRLTQPRTAGAVA